MKKLAIIAEYNPFHAGHQYHLQESLKKSGCSHSIIIMSGNYTQRGEPAIFNKYHRAKIAVQHGANLVIELPLIFSISSAENFADGAIRILDALDVDVLSFGSERANLSHLSSLAKSLDAIDHNPSELKKLLDEGYSYHEAKKKLLKTDLASNDILGVSYLRALGKYQSRIEPLCIERKGAMYHEEQLSSSFSSASSIRRQILQQKEVPVHALGYRLEPPARPVQAADFYPMMLYSMLTTDLKNIYAMNEGLDHAFKESASKCNNYSSFLKSMISRRYPASRIARQMLYILFQITKEKHQTLLNQLYLRPIAFDEKGRELLASFKNTTLKKIDRIDQYPPQELKLALELEAFASNLYYFISKESRHLEKKKKVYYDQSRTN